MSFPTRRMRRLRGNPALREMICENHLSVEDLIFPMFVVSGYGVKKEISTMPGQYQCSGDVLKEEARKVYAQGISAVLLFGIPSHKDESASSAYQKNGVVQEGIRAIKEAVPDLFVITDVCLCAYTSHGHCGIVEKGKIRNDATLELLARTAVSHAEAGADMAAPSDMMDGRVRAIRRALDESNFPETPILSYSVKYASAFYGPFRKAADSAPHFGDRRSYQTNPPNLREAILEAELDVEEGADILMVKPALAYLDVLRAIREKFSLPVAVYNVSGEYAMIKAAVEKGWLDEKKVVLEMMSGFKRAGSDLIISYHARDAARWLEEEAQAKKDSRKLPLLHAVIPSAARNLL